MKSHILALFPHHILFIVHMLSLLLRICVQTCVEYVKYTNLVCLYQLKLLE